MAQQYGKRTSTLPKAELKQFAARSIPAWQKEPEYQRLQEKYGKYIFVPFDVPAIQANDLGKFKEWFLDRAQPTYKRLPDIANPDQTRVYNEPSFMSVDAKDMMRFHNGVWDYNCVSDLYEVFPEVKEQILTYLPFEGLEYYNLWSSIFEVSPHRDAVPLIDAPFAFRINLYDENPGPTLSLHRALPDMKYEDCEKRLLNLPENVNAFSWNNFRAMHSSTKDKRYMKVLMIVASTILNKIDVKKLEALYDRSIAKYPEFVWEDTYLKSDYVDL